MLFKQLTKELNNAHTKTMPELQATHNKNNEMRDMPTPMEHRTPETNSQALSRHIPQTRQAHTRQRHPLLAMWRNSQTKRSLDSRSCDSRRSGFPPSPSPQVMQQQTWKHTCMNITQRQPIHAPPHTFFLVHVFCAPRCRACVHLRVLSCFYGKEKKD
jgi:hypothetical protein